MDRAHRFVALAAATAMFGCATFGLGATSAASAGTLPARHLYVADAYANVIYRFALARDGLPARLPDLTLLPSSPAYGLETDGQGNLYVADGNQAEVFAPGQRGYAKPIRTLSFGSDNVEGLGVNAAGYLFADSEDMNGISIYAPGAQGHAVPLHIIDLWGPFDAILDVTVDAVGRLYVMAITGVYIFDDPLRQWHYADRILEPQRNEHDFGSALAVDGTDDELYINACSEYEYGYDAFAVRSILSNAVPDKGIFTQDNYCFTDVAAVISGQYLVLAVGHSGVDVYRAYQFGVRQQPVEFISLGSPGGIALGP